MKIFLVKVVEITKRLEPMTLSIKLAAQNPKYLPKGAMKEKRLTLSYPGCFAIGDVFLVNARYDKPNEIWIIQPFDHCWIQTATSWICVHCGTKVRGSLFIEPCLRCGNEVGASEVYCASCAEGEAIRC